MDPNPKYASAASRLLELVEKKKKGEEREARIIEKSIQKDVDFTRRTESTSRLNHKDYFSHSPVKNVKQQQMVSYPNIYNDPTLPNYDPTTPPPILTADVSEVRPSTELAKSDSNTPTYTGAPIKLNPSVDPINPPAPTHSEAPILDWSRVLNKSVRSSDMKIIGYISGTIGDKIIISASKNRQYKVPKSLVEGFYGSEILLKVPSQSRASKWSLFSPSLEHLNGRSSLPVSSI
jgi:hypothetical protein